MKVLSKLVVICLLGVLQAHALPEDMGEDEQHVGRRYAESTIASEIGKIKDSMLQKNFVEFLLNQREKKSKPDTAEDDPDGRLCNELLTLSLHEKQRRRVLVCFPFFMELICHAVLDALSHILFLGSKKVQ